jgi:hypothetical protein
MKHKCVLLIRGPQNLAFIHCECGDHNTVNVLWPLCSAYTVCTCFSDNWGLWIRATVYFGVVFPSVFRSEISTNRKVVFTCVRIWTIGGINYKLLCVWPFTCFTVKTSWSLKTLSPTIVTNLITLVTYLTNQRWLIINVDVNLRSEVFL